MNLAALYTARLILLPVSWRDTKDVIALKADVGAFSHMLGGVRSSLQAQIEMAEDLSYWGQYRIGLYTIHEKQKGNNPRQFLGIAGIHHRLDGRGKALRFALYSWAWGKGYAREAAAAVLIEAHDRGLKRIIAVAREDNISSRRVLGGIGMHLEERFMRDTTSMLVYVSQSK